MAIHEVGAKTVVQFGTGDISILQIKHEQMDRPIGLHLGNLPAGHNVGEQVMLNGEEETKEIIFRFDRLASLDVLLSQFKLLRGSMADGELLNKQPVMVTGGHSSGRQASFVRLIDGDINNCILLIDGKMVRESHTNFRFMNPDIQQYFNQFYDAA